MSTIAERREGYSLEDALNGAGLYNKYAGNPSSDDTEYGIKPDAVINITQGWNDYHRGIWSN